MDMGVTTHLDGYPAEGLGGLTLGVTHWRWPTPTPRSPTAAGATRRSRSPVWRSPAVTSTPTGAAPPRQGPRRRGRRQGHRHPASEHPRRHGRQRQHRLPGRRQDRDDGQLHRRLARRLHTQAVHGGMGGLPQRQGADARRARHPGPGRQPAGGHLAPVHGPGHRQQLRRLPHAQPCDPVPALLGHLRVPGRARGFTGAHGSNSSGGSSSGGGVNGTGGTSSGGTGTTGQGHHVTAPAAPSPRPKRGGSGPASPPAAATPVPVPSPGPARQPSGGPPIVGTPGGTPAGGGNGKHG